MAKPPTNHRQPWTKDEVKELKQLAKENTPARVMGLKLGRPPPPRLSSRRPRTRASP